MSGYNDPQEQAVQQQQPGQPQQQYYGDDPNYGYTYPGDMWAGRPSSDQASQVRQAIFECKLPEKDEDFKDWFQMMRIAIDIVARIPGISSADVDRLNRKFKFVINRANSQGCRSITESKMQEFIFLLRSMVAQGDTPVVGLTGVEAMIATHTNQKQEIRYPTQQQQPPGLMDIYNRIRGR
jgi:hypothetical protein